MQSQEAFVTLLVTGAAHQDRDVAVAHGARPFPIGHGCALGHQRLNATRNPSGFRQLVGATLFIALVQRAYHVQLHPARHPFGRAVRQRLEARLERFLAEPKNRLEKGIKEGNQTRLATVIGGKRQRPAGGGGHFAFKRLEHPTSAPRNR